MIQSHYIKYGTLSGLLLLCTIILNTTDDSQRLVFAQITPASPSSNSSPDSDASNNNDETSDSSSSDSNDDENHNDGFSGANGSGDSSSSESDDSGETNSEDNEIASAEETNPLLEAIMQRVTNELAAAGITDLVL